MDLESIKAQMDPNRNKIEWGDIVMRKVTSLGQYGTFVGSFTKTDGTLYYVAEMHSDSTFIFYGPAEDFQLVRKTRRLPEIVSSKK